MHRVPLFLRILGLFALVGSLTAGCSDDPGDGDGGAGSKAKKTAEWLVQEPIEEKVWQAEVQADADLGALAADMKLAFAAAGVIEDADGNKVWWAEYAKDNNSGRDDAVTLIKSCDAAGTCVVGTGKYTADGASLTQADGATLALSVGTPTLNKKLKTSNIDSGTVILAGLERKTIIDPALSKIYVDNGSWGTRKLVILNRFGSQMGVELAAIVKAAKDTQRFDEIRHLQFVRRRDIDVLLPQLNALDVVVWVGAGVVKPFGEQPYRSVGMTVSRGVVGDELYHTETLGKLLDAPPLGGPGLVILAGGNSLTTNKANSDVLGKKLNLGPYRPVVGIEGAATVATAEAGVVALLGRLAAGDSLQAAITSATGKLDGAKFVTAMIEEQAEVWKLPASNDKIWGQQPKSGSLQLYVKIDPLCADVSGVGGVCNGASLQQGKAIPPQQITPILDTKFTCEPTFNGPYFSCEVDNPTLKAKFWLKGLVTGSEKGASVMVYAQGQSDGKVKDFAVVGAGIVEKVDKGGGTTVVSFGGPAAGSTFWNQDGHCCLAKTPLLTGHASNLFSKLEVKP